MYYGAVATTQTPAARPPGEKPQAQPEPTGRKRTDIAFLIAQLGAYAAERFGERAAALDFTLPVARFGGLIFVVAASVLLPASRHRLTAAAPVAA